MRSSIRPPTLERSLWQVTQYLSSIARQFAADASGARFERVCAASGICHAAKIRIKDDFVKDKKGRMQRSSRSRFEELCVEGRNERRRVAPTDEPDNWTRPVYRKAPHLTIRTENFL